MPVFKETVQSGYRPLGYRARDQINGNAEAKEEVTDAYRSGKSVRSFFGDRRRIDAKTISTDTSWNAKAKGEVKNT